MLDATANKEWTFFSLVHLCLHEEQKETKSNNLFINAFLPLA